MVKPSLGRTVAKKDKSFRPSIQICTLLYQSKFSFYGSKYGPKQASTRTQHLSPLRRLGELIDVVKIKLLAEMLKTSPMSLLETF
jgi:hypothetical protein